MVMEFTQYIEEQTVKYKKKWLNNIISEVRQRITSHLEGNEDKKLFDELTLKQKTIMNNGVDTIERFMNGILKLDVLAQALYEPNTRNVPKDKFVIEYLEDKGINLNPKGSNTTSNNFGLHQSLKNIEYKEHNIEFAIWSNKSNDAGISNKFISLKKKTFKTPTILVVEGPKVKPNHLDSLNNKKHLKVMNIEQFIKWAK
jgi:hypothetical protein|tara:strand:- start:1067 stop:1666 length:600 start_codon:yes stop_codon:yes gene_type:complete